MKKLILASASPRRREILEKFGYKFILMTSDAKEDIPPGIAPAWTARFLAREKGICVLDKLENGTVILSADTIVVLDGKILGKPSSPGDAFNMLSMLQSKAHTVYTGVCIIDRDSRRAITFVSQSRVFMAPLTSGEIRDYIATKEPLDKAGAYSVQGIGAAFIEKIDGDFYGVMGLPIRPTYQELGKMGVYPDRSIPVS